MENQNMDSYASRIQQSPSSGFSHFDTEKMQSISIKLIHDELLTKLRDCIITGKLRSGQKIPEKDLCNYFGISRTPLREALKVLAYEGLVVLNHNRGAIVKPLTMQDITEAFPIYSRLEALAGELACKQLSRGEIDGLRALHDQMTACYERGDLKGLRAANENIHSQIQAASRNRNLVQIMRAVSGRVQRIRHSVTVPETRLACALIEHEKIMVALEKRDSSLLSLAIRDHIGNAFQFFRDILSARQAKTENMNLQLT